MTRLVRSAGNPDFGSYSEVIDVRSPGEFAQDHVPDAINLWVLDDAERARVGTVYKQVSPFEAKKIGAALVAKNIANWIDAHFLAKDRDYRPLLYCWRGGQRSGSMATVISRIGWDVTVLEGGYKRYRTLVRETLEQTLPKLRLLILTGLTGTAKTRLLQALAMAGEQVLDLEGLASHRGSLLGLAPNDTQPTQKYFESLLAQAVRNLDPNRVTWIESESARIGRLQCPPPLWEKMQSARAVEIGAPMTARIEHLLEAYQHFLDDPATLKQRLGFLLPLHGHAKLDAWFTLIDTGRWSEFVEDILLSHYDPTYARSTARSQRQIIATLQHGHHQDSAAETLVPALREIALREQISWKAASQA